MAHRSNLLSRFVLWTLGMSCLLTPPFAGQASAEDLVIAPPTLEPPYAASIEDSPDSDEPTANEVHEAPLSGEDISGVVGGQPVVSGALWIPRVILFPVRGALEVVMAPIRGLVFVEQKYAVRDRLEAFFFTEDGNFGIYPMALAEVGFGLNIGLRLTWKDIFGSGVKLKSRLGYGGRFTYLTKSTLSLPMSDVFQLSVEGLYELRPQDRFFGYGNGDSNREATLPLSPLNRRISRETLFSETLARLGARAELILPYSFGLALEGSHISRSFGPLRPVALSEDNDDDSIEEVYEVDQLPGYNRGVDYLYTELELTFDTRRKKTRFESDPIPGTGWFLELYGGLASAVSEEPTSFFRFGVDGQRYIRLGMNPRTWVLRAHYEGMVGDIDKIPFTALPRLGGPELLRGYERDQFRDLNRILITSEYQFDLSHMFAGFLFLDAGQVFEDFSEFEWGDSRLGFGGGLQIHTKTSYIGRLILSSSMDGDVHFAVSFDPAFDIRSRTERK